MLTVSHGWSGYGTAWERDYEMWRFDALPPETRRLIANADHNYSLGYLSDIGGYVYHELPDIIHDLLNRQG